MTDRMVGRILPLTVRQTGLGPVITRNSAPLGETVILVVSLNPALHVTHHVAGTDWAGINRAHTVQVQAGGKGLNVAKLLRALDQRVLLTGMVGGLTGHALVGGIAAAGIDSALTQIADDSRRAFSVSDTVSGQTA